MEKRLIWDWNGTLLDDVPAAVNALNRMLVKRGASPMTIAHYRSRFGFPVRSFYAELGVDLNRWDWDEICEDFHSYIAEEPQSIREDTVSALQLAKDHGFSQCVLSALRQDLLERSLEKNGLMGFFDLVYGVDNLDGASKLQRGHELVAALGAGVENAIMIGDTLHDAEVAKALGIGCVLVSCGHQRYERLAAAGVPVASSLVEAVKHAALWKKSK
jgi:phosphoglycolate phosphatase